MKRIGITGIPGFIGDHVENFLNAFPDQYEILSFRDEFFEDEEALVEFVSSADVIVHLAGVNRHEDQNYIYSRNIELADLLINALVKSGNIPHLIFSSSSQEVRDNMYGHGKKEARKRLARWAENNQAPFAGLIIPNVFGPFGRPFYNSVVATFCYQLIHGEIPEIKIDTELDLIYIADLVKYIQKLIDSKATGQAIEVPSTGILKVSDIFTLLQNYMSGYLTDQVFPEFHNPLETALFNTLRSYREVKENAAALELHSDERGHLVEIVKDYNGGQTFFSLTKPGVTRGNHFHTRKVERFCVVQGDAMIRVRRLGTEDIIEFPVSGKAPVSLDIPVFYTHNITNIGSENMLTLFWTNEIFNFENSDTYYEQV